jgi:hypothetical protein
MFDIFYFGSKPNVAPFETPAVSLTDAADRSKTEFFWYIYGNNDYAGFNFHTRHVPWENEHTYVYGDDWQKDAGVYLTSKEHYQKKILNFKTEQRVKSRVCYDNWSIPDNVDIGTVDNSWHPDIHAPAYIYHFPSQHQSASGVTYTVPGATEVKLLSDFVVTAIPTSEHWVIPENFSADTSWHPNVLDSAYIYHFPSQHQSASGVTYITPGANEIKIVSDCVVTALPSNIHWDIPDNIDADTSWHPNPLDPAYIYHFSDDYQEASGTTYNMPGATEIKIVDSLNSQARVPDMFFIDKNNQQAAHRFAAVKEQYPNVQKVRFANSTIETIKRCAVRSTTTRFWILSSDIVYDNFDFAWHPGAWQNYMTHVFGSKWQKWSDTYLINKWELERTATWAKSIAEFPNLNFVDNQHVVIPEDLYDAYYIDHNNISAGIKHKFPNAKTTRFVDNYLDTLKRVMSTATTEYIWVTSSLCDYTKFDFSWQPEPWQAEMLHVFPSNQQKFGDTFYIHVESFKQQMDSLELLEWFDTVNFCSEQTVPRVAFDQVVFTSDSVVDAIKQHQFTTPYATFTTDGSSINYTPSMWRKQDRAVHSFTQGGSISIVPRDIQAVLSSQVYDYPYIVKHKKHYRAEKALDIVYISNGEPDAERWYEHTCRVAGRTVKRVQNVNGRSQAYKAAANVSDTPWFFTVFAKLQMVDDFNWAWQPDRLQEAKHYIFNARNPVNGLEYGHQGMIVYNKRLVLETEQSGLDFTLSKAHEVVPVLSGTAHFNQDAWTTWRTAFRETLKLKQFMAESPTMETEHRLNVWLTVATGDYAEYCLSGAQDAIEYYKETAGDYQQLMQSFEWDWLKQRFNRLCKN